jgi:hypothetical protein
MEDQELQLAPPEDDGNPIVKYAIAGLAMILIAVAVFLLNPRKTAEVSVQKVEFYSPPAVAPPVDTVMYPGNPKPAEDDLYVVTTVQITDKLRLPILPDGPSATLTLADGSSIDGQFLSGEDLPRLETEFPALTPLLTKPDITPIAIGETIAPGATRTGEVVLLFPQVTEAAWHAKKSATLTINISRQKPVSVPLP